MSSLIKIHLVDPRAAVIYGVGWGKVRLVFCGERRGPCGVILIVKPRGGSARTRTEVVA